MCVPATCIFAYPRDEYLSNLDMYFYLPSRWILGYPEHVFLLTLEMLSAYPRHAIMLTLKMNICALLTWNFAYPRHEYLPSTCTFAYLPDGVLLSLGTNICVPSGHSCVPSTCIFLDLDSSYCIFDSRLPVFIAVVRNNGRFLYVYKCSFAAIFLFFSFSLFYLLIFFFFFFLLLSHTLLSLSSRWVLLTLGQYFRHVPQRSLDTNICVPSTR